jgi:hypothetical protein
MLIQNINEKELERRGKVSRQIFFKFSTTKKLKTVTSIVGSMLFFPLHPPSWVALDLRDEVSFSFTASSRKQKFESKLLEVKVKRFRQSQHLNSICGSNSHTRHFVRGERVCERFQSTKLDYFSGVGGRK